MIVTSVPAGPELGRQEVMAGAGEITVNESGLVAVPVGAVTEMGPLVAPLGTVALIWIELPGPALTTAKEAAARPLKVTAVGFQRSVPVIVTLLPGNPLAGSTLVMVGGVSSKEAALVAVPPGVVTEMGPLVAAAGTVALTRVSLSTSKSAAAWPLNRTAVAPARFTPSTQTTVVAGPLVGRKLVIAGVDGVTMKLLALVAVPSGTVTVMGPVTAPVGTEVRYNSPWLPSIWPPIGRVNVAGRPLKVRAVG